MDNHFHEENIAVKLAFTNPNKKHVLNNIVLNMYEKQGLLTYHKLFGCSARLALPGPEEKSIVSATENIIGQNPAVEADQLPLPLLLPQAAEQSEGSWQPEASRLAEGKSRITDCEPIIEEPSSPEPVSTHVTENDMEDTFCEDPDEIPTIKLTLKNSLRIYRTICKRIWNFTKLICLRP